MTIILGEMVDTTAMYDKDYLLVFVPFVYAVEKYKLQTAMNLFYCTAWKGMSKHLSELPGADDLEEIDSPDSLACVSI